MVEQSSPKGMKALHVHEARMRRRGQRQPEAVYAVVAVDRNDPGDCTLRRLWRANLTPVVLGDVAELRIGRPVRGVGFVARLLGQAEVLESYGEAPPAHCVDLVSAPGLYRLEDGTARRVRGIRALVQRVSTLSSPLGRRRSAAQRTLVRAAGVANARLAEPSAAMALARPFASRGTPG